MAGAAVSKAPVPGMGTSAAANPLTPSPLYVNSFRISAVTDRLFTHLRAGTKNDSIEFFNLCLSLARYSKSLARQCRRRVHLSLKPFPERERMNTRDKLQFDLYLLDLRCYLDIAVDIKKIKLFHDKIEFFRDKFLDFARGIDYAVANNDIPNRAPDLPLLLKQVCQRTSEPLLQAAIMVLMISAKNACKSGWFTDKDSKELHILSNEMESNFCNARDMNTEESSFLPTIATIMSRFYPQMKLGQILAFLEVKPGYGAFVKDFQILKNGNSSKEDKIFLLVAQTDNIETSSCIISPQQVNFLLNGKGVEKRTNIDMDAGPWMPTNVTRMLKYGTNLLQAVGQFNGDYIIVVAYMSTKSTSDGTTLLDYNQPAVNALDSDSEIIEGPSRISLNCPISFKRIKTPVKGHLCKHLQCFDFNNFMDINSRRPSWRCPHCNQCVCFIDIRIDQNMVKVLRDVGENVVDVIISADGSWKAVTESEEHKDKRQGRTLLQEPTSFAKDIVDLDLTDGDTGMDSAGNLEKEDRKPSLATFHGQSTVKNPSLSQVNSITNEVNRNPSMHSEDGFWPGVYVASRGIGISNSRSDTHNIPGGVSDSTPASAMFSSVPTDATSASLNRELQTFQSSPSQISVPNSLQLQQYVNSNINEYGRFPTANRQVNRAPIAVQALPAQASAGVPSNVERQQQFSRSHLNTPQVSRMTSSSSQQYMGSQSWGRQDLTSIPTQPTQQFGAHPSSAQQPGAYRVAPAITAEHSQPIRLQNLRVPHPLSQSPSMVRSSTTQPAPHLARTQVHQGSAQSGVVGSGNLDTRFIAAQRAVHLQRMTHSSTPPPIQAARASLTVKSINADALRPAGRDQRGNMGATTPSIARPDTVDASAEQNWRPSGRMRGSLSGRAYSDALNQYITQPTQPVQAARPNILSPPSVLPSQLQALMANKNAQAQHEVGARGSEVLPEQSAGKQ